MEAYRSMVAAFQVGQEMGGMNIKIRMEAFYFGARNSHPHLLTRGEVGGVKISLG